jgi:hypothetical protein
MGQPIEEFKARTDEAGVAIDALAAALDHAITAVEALDRTPLEGMPFVWGVSLTREAASIRDDLCVHRGDEGAGGAETTLAQILGEARQFVKLAHVLCDAAQVDAAVAA